MSRLITNRTVYDIIEIHHYSEVLLGRWKTCCTQRAHLSQGHESGQKEKKAGDQQEVDRGENSQSKIPSSKIAGKITLCKW